MKRFVLLCALALVAAFELGCGGASQSSNNQQQQQGQVFITGEDAPVSSVVAFNITINSIALNNSSTSVTAMSTPTTVDFGRLVGLRSLLGFNSIAPGTYTSATFTFATSPAPSINYVNLSGTPPDGTASIGTATGTLTNSTVTVSFPTGAPLVVTGNELGGLHMDMDIRDSLAFDSNNNLIISNGTIAVNPVITIASVSASGEEGQITEFGGNIVSVNTSSNTFVIQGPYGFQETIDVNSSTSYNSPNSLATLPVDGIVAVEGTVQDDGSILASSVELVTTDKAFISGRILSVAPGPVVTMFVGEEIGTSATIPVDSVYTVDLSQVSTYDICFIDNWVTNQLFSGSSLWPGQRIFVGGTYAGNTFTPDMVSLRRQGVVGSLVSNSVNITSGNQGNFEMQNDALMSYAAGGPFVVYTGQATIFVNINGLSGLSSAGSANLISRGLVFYDPTTQQPVVWAGRVRVLPVSGSN